MTSSPTPPCSGRSFDADTSDGRPSPSSSPELLAALRALYESGGDSTDAMYAAGELLARIDATDKPA